MSLIDKDTLNTQFIKRDLKHIWHPCTQMKDHEWLPMIPIKKGDGIWLEDFEGNRFMDAVSSWWVNLFGHNNPRINNRIKQQIDTLEHVIFAGFTHEPIIELSERLVTITPPNLDRCFYADNGSSAIEAALKMSYHYWRNTGKPEKSKFITLGNSYHGETLGALAVGDVALYKETYEPLLMTTITAPSPDCFIQEGGREAGQSWQDFAKVRLNDMEALLQKHHAKTSAVIIEPLVQCAGHMRMYHADYITGLRKLCDDYNVHLIADEIAVGFGRTGTLFACEQAGISPDFMTISKGLTGGYLPLAAVMTSNHIYDAFYDEYDTLKAFLHSHSYTGNPLCCTAALATLDIFQQDSIIEKNQALIQHLHKATQIFKNHPNVAEVRQTGMIVAIELVKNKATGEPFPWQERRGLEVYKYGLKNGALLRPLGNVVYYMPPYIITKAQIDWLIKLTWKAIDHAVK